MSAQLFASYARVQDARALAAIVDSDDLSESDKKLLSFGQKLEEDFLSQGQEENRSMGIKNVEDLALGLPAEETFTLLLKSVMGVDLPTVRFEEQPQKPAYGFYTSDMALDLARATFNRIRYRIYQLAEVENSVFKLAFEIDKTRRRTNALKYIQLPRYQALVKEIQDTMEEKERDDYFRLKRVKKAMTRLI